jgi:hypothetical protein
MLHYLASRFSGTLFSSAVKYRTSMWPWTRLGFPSRLPSTLPICPSFVSFMPWRRGGSQPSLAGGFRFRSFWMKVWWGSAHVVAAAPSPIKSPRFRPHLNGEIVAVKLTYRWARGRGACPLGRVMCLAPWPNSEPNFGKKCVESEQLVRLDSTVGLAFLHICVRADINGLGLYV